MKEKNTVFVLNSLSGGGAEASAMSVVRALNSQGKEIGVIGINSSIDDDKFISENIRVLKRRWRAGARETAFTLVRFIIEIRTLRPDIIVAHCELPELFCALLLIRKVRLIAVEHTSNPWNGRRLTGWLIRGILKFRGVLWVTVSSNSEAIWCGSKSPQYIANPISISEIVVEKSLPNFEVVFIGRLRPEKRAELLISSAIQVGINVDIFGDGSLREVLQEKYINHSSTIRFHGFIANPWQSIPKESLVVVPSEYEGDGMVVAEAILRGHPILLADNLDLRRFKLPNGNYFKGSDELQSKLLEWKSAKKQAFQIPAPIVSALKSDRDINTIVERWHTLLNEIKPLPK